MTDWPFGDLKRGHYGAILADPPWHFETWGEGGNRNVTSKYRTMSAEEMGALPVGNLAAENSILFVWAVWPKLFEARNNRRCSGFMSAAGRCGPSRHGGGISHTGFSPHWQASQVGTQYMPQSSDCHIRASAMIARSGRDAVVWEAR